MKLILQHHLHGSKLIHNTLNLIVMLGEGLTFLELEVDELSNQESLVVDDLPFIEIFKLLLKGSC